MVEDEVVVGRLLEDSDVDEGIPPSAYFRHT